MPATLSFKLTARQAKLVAAALAMLRTISDPRVADALLAALPDDGTKAMYLGIGAAVAGPEPTPEALNEAWATVDELFRRVSTWAEEGR